MTKHEWFMNWVRSLGIPLQPATGPYVYKRQFPLPTAQRHG